MYCKLFLLTTAVAATPAYPGSDYGCSPNVIIPASLRFTGFYGGDESCTRDIKSSNDTACQFVFGNWSFAQSSVWHYGVPYISGSGASTQTSLDERGGSLTVICIDSITYNESAEMYSIVSASPAVDIDVQMCMTLTLISNSSASITAGFSSEGVIACTSAVNNIASFTIVNGTYDDTSTSALPLLEPLQCPSVSVVPSAFVQPPVTAYPANELDFGMPRKVSLVPAGYRATFIGDLLQETFCAIRFNLVEDNRADDLTRWELVIGDSTQTHAVGCMSFIRLGRTVVYAERFIGNSGMDASCGGPAVMDTANLCCWNFTYSEDTAHSLVDGTTVKVLFNYFPAGWTPGGSTTPSAAAGASAATIAASVLGGLLVCAGIAIFLLMRWHKNALRKNALSAEDIKSQSDGLLSTPETREIAVEIVTLQRAAIQ
jgi:hypothetical protein